MLSRRRRRLNGDRWAPLLLPRAAVLKRKAFFVDEARCVERERRSVLPRTDERVGQVRARRPEKAPAPVLHTVHS